MFKKQYLGESIIFAPQLFYQTEVMTDSFNNNVTALSVETPVTFLNACLFVLAILSTISLSDAEPGEKPGGPPLLIFRPK